MGDLELRWPTWIGVVADDLEAQRRFYRDVLGFPEGEVGEGWVSFDMGSGRILELLARSEEPQYGERRVQVGFEVLDIQAAREELMARGVKPIGPVQGGDEAGAYWAYFHDGEGNVFEVTQRLV